jgi:hypothetical protein
MMRRRGLMFIGMAECWIVLPAFVKFRFETTKKQHRSNERQGTQTGEEPGSTFALPLSLSLRRSEFMAKSIHDVAKRSGRRSKTTGP